MDKKEFLKVSKEYLLANGFVKRTDNKYFCITSDVVVEIMFQHSIYYKGYYINCRVKPIAAFPNEDVMEDLYSKADVIFFRLMGLGKCPDLAVYQELSADEYLKKLQTQMDKLVFPFINGGTEYIVRNFDEPIAAHYAQMMFPAGVAKITAFIKEYKKTHKIEKEQPNWKKILADKNAVTINACKSLRLWIYGTLLLIGTLLTLMPLIKNGSFLPAIPFGAALTVGSVAFIVLHMQRKIVITESYVVLLEHGRIVKAFKRDFLERIIVYKTLSGSSVSMIVFDDGAFDGYVPSKRLFSHKSIRSASWICVEYSRSRLRAISEALPEVETIEYEER